MADGRKTEAMPGMKLCPEPRMETSVMDDTIDCFSTASEILTGRVLRGHYRRYMVTDVLDLSTGGESDLYLCREIDDDNSLSLPLFTAKVYHSARKIDSSLRGRLLDFLTSVDRDKSHLLPVIDFGEIHGTVFDIMPYMKGGDLSKHGKFSFKELIDSVIPQLNEALQEIHQAGFIHRDIKPKNLYLSDDGRVVVGDFGISSESVGEINLTRGRGTDGYGAPELKLNTVTKKSDYFSLGITVASLYKGAELFADIDVYSIGARIVGKNLPLRIAEEDSDLGTLIDGLIDRDPFRRFGYEEVKKWCSNPKAVAAPRTKHTYDRVYTFKNTAYNEPEELAEALAKGWNWACEHLYKGKLERFFSEQDQDLAVQADIIVERDCKRDMDLGLFRFLYYLDRDLPLCWRGEKYESIRNIANEILRAPNRIDADIMDLIKSGAISWRLEQEKGESADAKERLSRIKDIEVMAREKNRAKIAYYLFGYECIENKRFFMGDDVAKDVDEIFSILLENVRGFYTNCDALLSSGSFFAFLISLGYREAVFELTGYLGEDKMENYNLLLSLFYGIVSNKKAVTEFYIKYGTRAHLYWIKQNLNLYKFNGKAALEIRGNIEAVEFKNTMTLTELNDQFELLQKYIDEFQGAFFNNIFLSHIGIFNNYDIRGITSNNSDAFFIYDFLGRPAPNIFGCSGTG